MSRKMLVLLLLAILTPLVVPRIADCQTESNLDSMTQEQWQSDLRHLAELMPKVHTNLFHTMTQEQFQTAVTSLDSRIHGLNTDETLVELSRLTAMVQDGHTGYIRPLLYWSKENYPLKLVWYPDGIFVQRAKAEHADIVGGRVVQIGNVSIESAYNSIKDIFPHDQGNDGRVRVAGVPLYLTQPRVLHGLHIADTAREVRYIIEVSGQRKTVVLKPTVTAREISDRSFVKPDSSWVDARDGAASPTPEWLKHGDKQYWFDYLSDNKTLYVQFNQVLPEADQSIDGFFGDVFDFLDHHDVERFILDIRNNDGGDNGYLRPIIVGIIQAKRINRRGKLFTIIGPETFSAAQNLTNRLELYTETTFVGEPTAENVNFYGDDRRIMLPNSGLAIGMSQLWWQDEDPRDKRFSTAPEVAADMTFDDYRNNRDPALEEILAGRAEPLEETLTRSASEGFERAMGAFKDWASDPLHHYVANAAERRVNTLGYKLLEQKRIPEAVTVLRVNAETRPDSWNAWDSLGEAYAAAGKVAEAIAAYERSLKLNPESRSGIDALTLLRRKKP